MQDKAMKTWIKVVLSIVLILALLITAFVSYVLWDNRERPIERPPVVEEVLAPFELKREIYGDPNSFDQPRIQFSWQGPNRERPEIWSVKIDGTDLRLAVDADLLYPKDEDVGLHPGFSSARSPDNRYILVVMANNKYRNNLIHIIDLKEHKHSKINSSESALSIRYPWVSDSKSFFFSKYGVISITKSGRFVFIKNRKSMKQ